MPATILTVLRALVDAAFKGGTITDTEHSEYHGYLDSEDPAVAEAKALADAGLTAEEQAELDRLHAKQAAAAAGTEDAGFGG